MSSPKARRRRGTRDRIPSASLTDALRLRARGAHAATSRRGRSVSGLDRLGEPLLAACPRLPSARRRRACARAAPADRACAARRSTGSLVVRLRVRAEAIRVELRKNGAPVSRMRPTRPAASWIGSTSVVSSSSTSTPSALAPRWTRRARADGRRLRVVVVLDDEENRRLPKRGDVERLVRHASPSVPSPRAPSTAPCLSLLRDAIPVGTMLEHAVG